MNFFNFTLLILKETPMNLVAFKRLLINYLLLNTYFNKKSRRISQYLKNSREKCCEMNSERFLLVVGVALLLIILLCSKNTIQKNIDYLNCEAMSLVDLCKQFNLK